jgi:hypothetical protein
VAALGVTALAYGGVYVVTFALYYQYRYPIEPVLTTLGGRAVIWLVPARLAASGAPLRHARSRYRILSEALIAPEAVESRARAAAVERLYAAAPPDRASKRESLPRSVMRSISC